MMHLQLAHFKWLTSFARCVGPEQEEVVLSVLEKEATLVQGCWVLNSERACDGDKKKAAAREYMLLQWVDGDFIDRDALTKQVGRSVVAP